MNRSVGSDRLYLFLLPTDLTHLFSLLFLITTVGTLVELRLLPKRVIGRTTYNKLVNYL